MLIIEHVVSFSFDGITDPDTGSEMAPAEAYAQFLRELDEALRCLRGLRGYMVLEQPSMRWRVNVRLVLDAAEYLDDGAYEQELDNAIQHDCYEVAALSGNYSMAPSATYRVSYTQPGSTEVVSTSPEHAAQVFLSANPNATVLSVEQA